MPAQLVPALLIGAGAALRGVFLLFPALDSDQAIIGLMGLHILEGRFPPFFWGEPYSGTLESFLAALLFFLFGVSRQTLTLAPTLVSLGFLWAGWRLAREIFGERGGLIALALLAAPPVFLSWNGVLPRGNYVENLLLGTLCLLLAYRLGTADLAAPRAKRQVIVLGGLGGLAWYMSFQSIHYLLAAALYLGWRQRLALLRALPLAIPAFLVGSLPFWLANLIPGVASLEAIRWYSGRVGIAEGLRQLAGHLPVLLGAQGFTYTYERVPVGALPVVAPLAGWVFAAGVAVALAVGLRHRRPGILLLALLAAIGPALVLLGGFSLGDDPRYLLPLYSTLPLLLAGGLAAAWRWRPVAVGALALLLVSNLYGHWSLARGEVARFPRYRAEDRQLLDFLRARGFTYVYAPDYWLSYRLTFDAREEVVVATPFWRDYPRTLSKFPPYTRLVKAEATPAYLLWGSVDVYRGALRAAGIEHEATPIGRFTVLHDLRQPALGSSLPAGDWRGGERSAGRAFDRDPWTAWEGTEFRLDLGEVRQVGYVALHLGALRDHPSGLVIEASADAQAWRPLAEVRDVVPGFAWAGDKLLLEEHGRVGVAVAPTPVRHLRVLPQPPGRPWSLAELFVFETAAAGAPSPSFLEGVEREEARRWGEALGRYAAILLEEPDDEPALLRATLAARELRLASLAAVYDFLSARTLDRDPHLALRFARRFHELADGRAEAWRRLVRALEGVGEFEEAREVEMARAHHFTPAVASGVRFGRHLTFLGYTLDPPVLRPGETAEVSYFWQLARPLPPRFWVFAHVHDGKEIRISQDHRLPWGGGDLPWRPGEVVRSDHRLTVPPGLDDGTYALRVGVGDPASGRRLKPWHEGWPTRRRVVTVGTLEVSGRTLAAVEGEP